MIRNLPQLRTDEDVQQQLWAGHGGRERERGPVHCREGGDGAVGEAVRERAQPNHDEEFQSVVLEGQRKRGKARVVRYQAVDKWAEECP